ncbi:hypothetical protein [Rhizobium leguminosarum]|uniref:hypothetical protein n=1 Tax=Rhizobium leguminosarum TaxID=384 RepID=UPI001AEDE495|nr:hypothetical protein [Rhizobium leguminosarum]
MLALKKLEGLIAMLEANVLEDPPTAAHGVNRNGAGRAFEILLAEPSEGSCNDRLVRCRRHRCFAVGYALLSALILPKESSRARLLAEPDLRLALHPIIKAHVPMTIGVFDDAFEV